MHLRLLLGYFFGEGKQKSKGMIRHVLDAVIRHVADKDSLCGRGRDIHVIHTDAVSDDDPAPLQSSDYPCGNRSILHNQAVAAGGLADHILLGFALEIAAIRFPPLRAQRARRKSFHIHNR